jgi:phage terminase small subunit
MAVRRITIAELAGLTPQEANFVIEYCKDFSARRAAEASGYAADSGYQIKDKPLVAAAIEKVLVQRLESSHIDAEWVLMEAVDNHMIARQAGNVSASNTALGMVMKHKFVEAMAAEKVDVYDDRDVMERLLRGRKRMNDDEGDEVSFF